MGRYLDKLVYSYYQLHKDDNDLENDALTAMKEYEQTVVDEILLEHAEEAVRQEASLREERRKKEQEQSLRASIRSFIRLLLEGVALATIVGLIGSHIYGLGEAFWYAPAAGFNYVASVAVTAVLVVLCVALLVYMFVNSLPEWVANAMRQNDER